MQVLEYCTTFLCSTRGRVGDSGFHNDFAQGYLPRGRGEEKDHIRKVSFRDLDHSFERFHRTQSQRSYAKVNGNFGKVTAKDLDDDLERYHLEALSGLKSKMESEITTDSFNDSF